MKLVSSDYSTWAPFMEYLGFPYAMPHGLSVAKVGKDGAHILISAMVSLDAETLTVVRTPFPDFKETTEQYSELYAYVYSHDTPHAFLGAVHLTPGKAIKVESPVKSPV